jgi:hypothetical protein
MYSSNYDELSQQLQKETGIGEVELIAMELGRLSMELGRLSDVNLYGLTQEELFTITEEYNKLIQDPEEVKKVLIRHMINAMISFKKENFRDLISNILGNPT